MTPLSPGLRIAQQMADFTLDGSVDNGCTIFSGSARSVSTLHATWIKNLPKDIGASTNLSLTGLDPLTWIYAAAWADALANHGLILRVQCDAWDGPVLSGSARWKALDMKLGRFAIRSVGRQRVQGADRMAAIGPNPSLKEVSDFLAGNRRTWLPVTVGPAQSWLPTLPTLGNWMWLEPASSATPFQGSDDLGEPILFRLAPLLASGTPYKIDVKFMLAQPQTELQVTKPSADVLLNPIADQAKLQRIADYLIENPGIACVQLSGYASQQKSDETTRNNDLALSKRRANWVKNWLKGLGVKQDLEAEGYGATNFIAPKADASNQRVEATFQ